MSYNRFQTPATETPISQPRPYRTILNFEPEEDTGERSAREALLREGEHLTRSEQLLDEQFDVAVKTREELINQRWSIKSMQTQYNNITDRFQLVGTLIKRIRIRKRRDTIILAIVFSICLGFLLYNLF